MISELLKDLRAATGRAPLLLPVLAALVAVIAVEGALAGLICCPILILLTFFLQGKQGGVAAILLVCFLGALHLGRISTQKDWNTWFDKNTSVSFTGSAMRVIGKNVLLQGYPQTDKTDIPLFPALVEIKLHPNTPPEIGTQYTLLARPVPFRQPMNPGEFDSKAWRYRLGISASLEQIALRDQQEGNLKSRILAASAQWNRFLLNRLDKGFAPGDPRGEVLKSLVLGAKSEASIETVDAFKWSGLLHIFAVSGLHVGLVALLVTPILLLMRLRPSSLAWVLGFILVCYDFSTGLSISANRATLMILVYLAASAFRRQNSPINRLALAALAVVAWDSHALFQMGFLLSFLVFASVVLAAASVTVLHKKLNPVDPFIPPSFYTFRENLLVKLTRGLISILLISFSAWLTASLIMAPALHYLSPYAPLANTILSLPVTLLMGGGLLCLLAGEIPWIGGLVFSLTKYLAGIVLAVAQFFSDLPGSAVSLSPSPPPGSLSIYSLYGNSYAAVMGNPSLLVESGSDITARNIIFPALRAEGYTPHILALSHYHKAQAEGFSFLQQRENITTLIAPYPRSATQKKYIPSELAISPLHKGQRWNNGNGGTLTLLTAPVSGKNVQGEDENPLVFLWEYSGKKILFLGDAGIHTEQQLKQDYPELKSNIVVLGNHKTDHSGSEEFLLSLEPEWIIYTDELQGYPSRSSSWKERLENNGCKLHSLLEKGAFHFQAE